MRGETSHCSGGRARALGHHAPLVGRSSRAASVILAAPRTEDLSSRAAGAAGKDAASLSRARPYLQFAHANGFPGACYRKLFALLAVEFDVGYLPAIGHDARFPVTEGWPLLVDELVASVVESGRAPVLGVGHSLGGYLTFLAAIQRPELFRAIILLDAPILGRFHGSALAFAKHVGLIDRVTPAGATRDRRREWPSSEAALAHFRRKPLFRRFDPDCLIDYVRHGTVASANGVRLAFDPQVEYQIYRTIPHDMMRHLPKLRVPAAFIGGADSDVVRRIRLAGMKPKFVFRKVPGGHLFPFEHPREAATSIARVLDDLAAARAA
jgi:pimeloyl-ACP methyl ester carboxylesterase